MSLFFRTIIYLLAVSFCISSCISNKRVPYFSENGFNRDSVNQVENTTGLYRLQPGDVINIRIKTLDIESSAYFNILAEEGVFNYNVPGLYINSYSINPDGYIELPEVGKVAIAGHTLSECRNTIRQEMAEYLNNATVIVKLVSFKITVLGEVRSPGHHYVYNDRANLLEGIGMSQDLTDFGDRENISVIRQTRNGSEVKIINLNDAEVLKSDFYYLKPNDVIYVPPVKAKIRRGNAGNFTLLSVFFSAVSSIVLVLNFIDN